MDFILFRSFGYRLFPHTFCWAFFVWKHWPYQVLLKDSSFCSHLIGRSWKQVNVGLMEAPKSSSRMESELEHCWHLDHTTNSTTTFIGTQLLFAASTLSHHSSRRSSSSRFSDLWQTQKVLTSVMWWKVVLVLPFLCIQRYLSNI